MYIYENHLGGLYATEQELSYEDTHCSTCGDSDWLIGKANTRNEAFWIIARLPYYKQCKRDFLNEYFTED